MTGDRDPPEKSQKYRFLSNTGPDPLKNHKVTKSAFNVGPSSAHQLKRHLNDDLLIVVFGSFLIEKKTNKKYVVKVGLPH